MKWIRILEAAAAIVFGTLAVVRFGDKSDATIGVHVGPTF